MLCKCHWIVLYTVHFTAFCLGGPFFSGHGVDNYTKIAINHDLEHSSITNCFLIVLYHVVQLRFDNSQYTNMLCYVIFLLSPHLLDDVTTKQYDTLFSRAE